MSKSSRSLTILALTLVLLAPYKIALADLLDETEVPKPSVEPKVLKDTEKADEARPQKPTDSKTNAKPEEDRARDEGLAPHPRIRQGKPGTTVVPPKTPAPKTGQTNDKPKKVAGETRNLPIHLDSRGARGLRKKGVFELLNDVVVTQGEMKLEADHAQVFFEENTPQKKESGIVKIVAEGSPVKINGIDETTGERFRAYGNQAVFLNKERTVVLEGNARLWRGDDSAIRSRKITYEMDTGWIQFDRVAGEVQPTERGNGAAPTKGETKANKKPSNLDETAADPKPTPGAPAQTPTSGVTN